MTSRTGNHDRLDELQARIDRYYDELDTIERSYGADPASMPEGKATRWRDTTTALTRAREEYDSIERAIREREDRLGEVLRAAQVPGRTERGDGGAVGNRDRRSPAFIRRGADAYDTDLDQIQRGYFDPGDVISRAKWAVEQAPDHFGDGARGYAMSLLDRKGRGAANIARHVMLTGSQQYMDEFSRYLQAQGRIVGPEILRALALSPDSAGGAMLPFHLDPALILSNLGIEGSIRSLATVKTIAVDAWHGVTTEGVTAAWIGEGSAFSDASPTFAQPEIPTHKAGAEIVGSYEVLADSAFSGELGMLVADAKQRLDETAFAVGAGSTEPFGIVTRAVATTASRVTAGTNSTFTAADVYNISAAASPRHASQSVWLANKSVYHKIRQFSTVTTGGTFWADMGVGRPSQLIGAATVEASAMDVYAANTTSDILTLVNPKSYYIVDRLGTVILYDQIIRATGSGRATGQAGWVCYWRQGGDLMVPETSARTFRQFTNSAGWS